MISIYKLSFPNDDRVYIGQTTLATNIRINKHISKLTLGTHHSKKMQKAWPKCGIPILAIIDTCDLVDRDTTEVFWIAKYNSFKEGFNATIGGASGGIGENHANAKYTLEDYECIVTCLAYTDWEQQEIASELGVKEGMVSDICRGATHAYLQDIIPITYTLMIQTRTNRLRKGKSNLPRLLSPTGGVYEVIPSIRAFAREHSLTGTNICKLIRGGTPSYRGWTIYKESLC